MDTAFALLPDFVLILLGYVLKRLFMTENRFWVQLERLIYFVLFPALLFHSVTRLPLDIQAMAPLILAVTLVMLAGIALGLVAQPLFRLPAMTFASMFQCAFRYNTYIGLAVAGKLHGVPGLAAMGIAAGFMVPLANLASVWALAHHGEARLWRELARNPLVLATLAGLLWNLLGLPFPEPARHFFGRLADAAISLGLLAVGAALKVTGALGSNMRLAAGWFLSVKLVMLPLVALAAIHWFALTGVMADVALIFAALPTATSAYILARRMGGDGPPVAWLISASTLAAMLSLPFWLIVGR